MTLSDSAQMERGERPGGDGATAPRAASLPVDWEALARASAHPLRISILEVLGLDGGRTLSPNELSQELQTSRGNANYHVTELHKAGLLRLSHRRPVRGVVENFYRLAY